MVKQITIFLLYCFVIPLLAFADDASPDFKTTEEILAMAHDEKPTRCASNIFANALNDHRNEISETALESEVRAWAQTTMFSKEVLERVLNCPEIQSKNKMETVVFTPIVFNFESGRTITINYRTQPKVLEQKLLLANKRSLPNGDPNPRLMDENDPAIYINTDPAWYAIMVVEHGSLSNFIGPDKNNTLSIKYINDNIESLYPRGYHCTSKSAIALDSDTINQVVHEVVNMEDDSNDYYVAGDVNLEWVMYAEIALDVAITVATVGIGEAGMVSIKAARAAKNAKGLAKSIRQLTKLDDVKKYMDVARKISHHSEDIARFQKYEKNLKNLDKARKAGKDTAKYEKEINETLKAAQKIDSSVTSETLKNPDKLKELEKTLKTELDEFEKTAAQMEKDSKNVKRYKESADVFSELMKYRRDLRAFRRPQTGNVIIKSLKNLKATSKTLKAANSGAKLMSKANKLARKGMSSFSSKAKSFLFDNTLKHGARIARVGRDVGLAYGVLSFLGDMYDKTSSTSQEYSNGIEFKPLCLLSADDLEGQDNVVNYGMWIMWEGNSTDPADDDAAYLQSIDFATKFHYVLSEYQQENGPECNVDIYVVHPIIRLDETNPNETKGELFYLFMNDEPWTTADQFDGIDMNEWEKTQEKLQATDPDGKYKPLSSDDDQLEPKEDQEIISE